MRLSQSVVVVKDQVHLMTRTAQISKEKRQSIITLRHGQELKCRKELKVSLSAFAKTIKRYDETGSHEDHHRKGRPRVTSAVEDKLNELNAPQIAAQINAS